MSQRFWHGSHFEEERCAMHRRARVCVVVVSKELQDLSAVSTAQDDTTRGMCTYASFEGYSFFESNAEQVSAILVTQRTV